MRGCLRGRQPLLEPRQPQAEAKPASRRTAPRAPRDPSAGYLDGMLLEGPDLAAQLPTLLLHPAAAARHLSCSGLRMVELRYAASSNLTSAQLDRLPPLSDLPYQICADNHEWPAHRLHLGALVSARPAEGTDLDVPGRYRRVDGWHSRARGQLCEAGRRQGLQLPLAASRPPSRSCCRCRVVDRPWCVSGHCARLGRCHIIVGARAIAP